MNDSESESNHSVSSNQPNEQAKKNAVVIDLEEMIKKSEDGLLSPACCIYRVPHVIRKLNQEAYTPKAVSIGPFHHRNQRLQNMEGHKLILFNRFIQNSKTNLDDLVHFTECSEPYVRACYSENIQLNKEALMKLILVDGGFIIELFRTSSYEENLIYSDAKLSKPWLANLVIKDLLLLENQLPFFFLEGLFNRAITLDIQGYDGPSFRKLTYDYFGYYNIQGLEPISNVRIKHFTDLLRLFHLPGWKIETAPSGDVENDYLNYSVSELQEAGVKFKVNKSKCLLDIKFSKHVLEIPYVEVEDGTETLFRNMIALEQCHYPEESYIIDYALILDCLINTIKDVDVLVHERILRNWLGDPKEVVKVFNGLGKNIIRNTFNSNYLDICKNLNEFHKNHWHQMKTTLRRDYCKTPWQTAASIAAIVLLILTLVQTIFSILTM